MLEAAYIILTDCILVEIRTETKRNGSGEIYLRRHRLPMDAVVWSRNGVVANDSRVVAKHLLTSSVLWSGDTVTGNGSASLIGSVTIRHESLP
jgi:hypothetical protein